MPCESCAGAECLQTCGPSAGDFCLATFLQTESAGAAVILHCFWLPVEVIEGYLRCVATWCMLFPGSHSGQQQHMHNSTMGRSTC